MHIFMPFRLRAGALTGVREIVENSGGKCTMHAYENTEKLRHALREASPDVVLSAESAPLFHVPRTLPTVYCCDRFYCADKRLPSDLAAYWIAHESLAFECMTHGARDRNVRVCGVPLPASYRRTQPRFSACRALGIEENKTVFSVYTDGVSPNEIKATVRAVRARDAEALVLLWCADTGKRAFWQGLFASDTAVYVPDADDRMPLSLSAADAVFTPAVPALVCAAARQNKIILLLHTASSACRKNAAFLDAGGAAFCGKTAADNVSFSLRLLSSERLRGNMLASQEKMIVRDAEERVRNALEEIAKK